MSARFPHRRIERALLVIIVLVVGVCAPARAQGLAALVTDARGKVEIQRPGQKFSPASVMAQAPAGSVLRVAAGGQATLAFVKGGIKVRLAGPVEVRVDAGGTTLVSGSAASVVATQPGPKTTITVPGGVNINKMGGVLTRGASAEPVLLTGPAVYTAAPLVEWRVTDDAAGPSRSFEQFNLRISDDQGAQLVNVTVPNPARSYQVPPGTLKPGLSYRVRLRAMPQIGIDENLVTRRLVVLDEKTADTLERARQEAEAAYKSDASDVTPLVMLTWMYLDHDVYGAALPLAERVLAARPQSKDAQLLLYHLYVTIGDGPRASVLKEKAGLDVSE